jgi:hypothetical protein
MAQTGETMRLLSRTPQTPRVFNTGAIMADMIHAVLGNYHYHYILSYTML